MHDFTQSELESIKRDAASSEGKSPQERVAMFIDLMESVEAILSQFPPEERARRLEIRERLNRRPDPWWRNFRREALDEVPCRTSSN